MKYREYFKPGSLAELVQVLKEVQEPVTLLAGGSDVLVYARGDDRYKDHAIVDIYGLAELKGIEEQGDWIRIGAGVTHSEIAKNPIVLQHAGALAKASDSVGSLQIRNHATLGGNIANASPAADTFASLAVLGAELTVNRLGEVRRIPLAEVVTGPYKTSLQDKEVIESIHIKKLPKQARQGYIKLGRRRALAISRLTVAGFLLFDEAGAVEDFSMTIGAAFPSPIAFEDVNARLVGRVPTQEDIEAVAEALSNKIPEITGVRKSTSYKLPVAKNLCRRLLRELVKGESK